MKIVCDTLFKDGTNIYEKDDVRTVSDEDGARFIAAGWAHEVGGEPAEGTVDTTTTDLKVDNIKTITGVSNA